MERSWGDHSDADAACSCIERRAPHIIGAFTSPSASARHGITHWRASREALAAAAAARRATHCGRHHRRAPWPGRAVGPGLGTQPARQLAPALLGAVLTQPSACLPASLPAGRRDSRHPPLGPAAAPSAPATSHRPPHPTSAAPLPGSRTRRCTSPPTPRRPPPRPTCQAPRRCAGFVLQASG